MEKKTEKIWIRCTPSEKGYVVSMADSQGKKVSEYLLDSAIVPQEPAKVVNQKVLMQLIYEINKIGHNLNQLTRLANTDKALDKEVLEKIDCMNILLIQLLKENKHAN
jgi:hypothetical protein